MSIIQSCSVDFLITEVTGGSDIELHRGEDGKQQQNSDDSPGVSLQKLGFKSQTIVDVPVSGERNDGVGISYRYRGFAPAGLICNPSQICNTRHTVDRTFQVHRVPIPDRSPKISRLVWANEGWITHGL